jgi:hypothetical protein
MTTWNEALEPRQYMAISLKAAKYYLEKAAMQDLPLRKTPTPHVKKYRWTRLSKPYIAAEDTLANVATGGREAEQWDEDPDIADMQYGFNDYDLGSIQMALEVKKSNIPQFQGPNLLADKREAQIEKFALDVDTGLIKGIYDRTGKVKVASGFQDQATSITNLNAVDSNLEVKGDIWKAFNKMIDAIPLGMRQASEPMICLISENLLVKATAPDRIYLQDIEWDYIKKYLMGERAEVGRKINPNVRITNDILVAGTDTKGTHDRIALYVPNTRWIAKVVSRSFSKMGEMQGLHSIVMDYGWTGRCIVDNALAAGFSEQIVWT